MTYKCNVQSESNFDVKNRIVPDPCDKSCNQNCDFKRTGDLEFFSIIAELFDKIDRFDFSVKYSISGNFLNREFEFWMNESLDSFPIEHFKNIIIEFNRRFISRGELIRKLRVKLFREITKKYEYLGQIEVDPTHWTQLGNPDTVRISGKRFLIYASTTFRITGFNRKNLITANLAVPERLRNDC